MAVIVSGTPQWMPLLDAIRHTQAKFGGSIENAGAAVLAALQHGVVSARRCGPEDAAPLDGRYEHWSGALSPAAWHLATVHEDGTVSFDVSEGIALLRRARQHEMKTRHTIEVERSAMLR